MVIRIYTSLLYLVIENIESSGGYFNWNPQASVAFENGEYWGEDSGINADTGISVPHGEGKYKSAHATRKT